MILIVLGIVMSSVVLGYVLVIILLLIVFFWIGFEGIEDVSLVGMMVVMIGLFFVLLVVFVFCYGVVN